MTDTPEGIVESLFHPPLQLLTFHVDENGPYTGNATIYTHSSGRPVGDYFGWYVRCTAVPVGLGFENGYVDDVGQTDGAYYIDRLFQLILIYETLSGARIAAQSLEGHYVDMFVMQEHIGVQKLGLFTFPGVSVDLFGALIG